MWAPEFVACKQARLDGYYVLSALHGLLTTHPLLTADALYTIRSLAFKSWVLACLLLCIPRSIYHRPLCSVRLLRLLLHERVHHGLSALFVCLASLGYAYLHGVVNGWAAYKVYTLRTITRLTHTHTSCPSDRHAAPSTSAHTHSVCPALC